MFSVGGVHRSSTSSHVRTLRCLSFSCFKPTSLCNLSSLSNAVVITVNANQALNRMPIERIRIDTCADDGMPTGRPYHWNARVWTSRLSGAHYGPETATSPEICRLLLAKLWLRSNYGLPFTFMISMVMIISEKCTVMRGMCKGGYWVLHSHCKPTIVTSPSYYEPINL